VLPQPLTLSCNCMSPPSGGKVAAGIRGFGFGAVRECGEKVIAALAGDVNVLGAERAANALFGERCGMHGVMQELGAVVIPQVVVGVFRVDAESGEFREGAHEA